MNDPFAIQNQHFLITGGTRGIGRALSLHLARQGAHVLANYVRDREAAEDLERFAANENLSLALLKADIASPKGVEVIRKTIEEKSIALSGFIHCAASGVHRPIEELTLRHFDFTYAINVRAFFELSRVLLPFFSNPASIVAVSSAGAVRAVDRYALTGSSKGALESLARHMAAEFIPRGIRVNILSPGTTKTDAWDALPHSQERLAKAAAQSPAGKLTDLEEIASAAHFLCSPASRGIVGHTLVVDNGCRIME
jgi:enoyl-[acyl-carrier protein] reductase III